MNTPDIIILVVLAVGSFRGWQSGLFRQIASVAGVILGLLVASMLYMTLGDWLTLQMEMQRGVAYALAFIMIWIGVPLALSVIAYCLTKTMETLCLGWLNRLGGAAIGAMKYLLLLSCVINVMVRLQFMNDPSDTGSRFYKPLKSVSGIFFDYCADHVRRITEKGIEDIC